AHVSTSSSSGSTASSSLERDFSDNAASTRHRWNISEASHAPYDQITESDPYQDIYSTLGQLPEPDDLMLPPTTVQTLQPGQKYSHIADLNVDDDPNVLQMESIDDFGELSDILDFSNLHNDLSDYEDYSTTNSSIDSFGEQIEHTTGILSKPLGQSTASNSLVENGSTSRLNAAPMVIHQLSTPVFGSENQSNTHQKQQLQPRQTARAHPDILAATVGYLNGQQSIETKTADGMPLADAQPGNAMREIAARDGSAASPSATATAVSDSTNMPPTTTATLTNAGHSTATTTTATAAGGSAATTATAAGSSTIVATPVNNTPLEIMEYASELEISLAREQEDYYSDNVSQ
ncbi:hypothetical protein GGI05_007596, partial [Coemansia sp. RSA 2603]